MSTNFTLEYNVSKRVNYSSSDENIYRGFQITIITVDATIAVVGALVNVWFIAALLLSSEIRARIRNKIICSMLVVNLTEAVTVCPLSVARTVVFLLNVYDRSYCPLISVHNNIYHIQDFLNNWYLVILICINTAQVMNFEPKFTPLWKKILTFAMFAAPCLVALLFVPLTMNSYYYRRYDDSCITTTSKSMKVYKSVDTIVPLTLAGLLLLVTSVLKRRRYSQGRSSGSLRAQLIDDGSQIDPLYTFVAVLVVAVTSEFCLMFLRMNPIPFMRFEIKTWISIYIAFVCLSYLRVIFMPAVFLLFRDIRERIKTWRPWRQSATRADLVVTYERNTS